MRLASPLADLDCVAHDVPLAPLTWYRVGGPARFLIRPRSVEELSHAVKRCGEEGIAVKVLGLGANLLVSDDGVDHAVLRLDDEAFRAVGPVRGGLTVGAGFDMQKLVLRCCREGLAGVEHMAGIYGTAGGGTVMNAGGRFGDWGQNVRSVRVMDAAGEVFERTRDDLHFGYRTTNITSPYVLSVKLDLPGDDPAAVTERTKEVWMHKRASQPLSGRSCGCAFVNPSDQTDKSAGRLIDEAGCKGLRIGSAEVSRQHANFVLAHKPAKAADVRELMQAVARRVEDHSGVTLRSEVKLWGFDE